MDMRFSGTLTHLLTGCDIYLADNYGIAANASCLFPQIPQLFEAANTNPITGDLAILPILPVGTHMFNWHIEDTISYNNEPTTFTVPIEYTVHPVVDSPIGITGAKSVVYDALADSFAVTMLENTTITVTFVLVTQPGQDTTFTFSTDSPHPHVVSAPVLVAAGAAYADWSAAQSVTLEVTPDGLTTGNYTFTLAHAVAGDAYTLPAISVTVEDIDRTSWILSETAFNVTEGDSATFTVRTGSKPTDPLVLTFPQHSLFSFSPAVVTITDADFDVPQTVTVAATQNTVVLGTVAFSIPIFTLATADAFYPLLTVPTLELRLLDDDLLLATMTPHVGNDDGLYNTTMQLDDAVTLDVRQLVAAAPMVAGFSVANTNVAASDLTVVDGNLINSTSPFYAGLNSSLVADYPGYSNVFIRTFYCRFGEGETFLYTPAYIAGPRTLLCHVPPCVENPLDVSIKCITPINVYLVVTNQDSTSQPFRFMWGPEHEVIDPLVHDPSDEVWRASVTGILPEVVNMREETWITVSGYHLAVETTRDNITASIPGVQPLCRFGGYLTKSAYFLDDADHDKGFRCLAPRRLDLTGDTRVSDVAIEVSIDGGTEFFTPFGLTLGYFDYRREKDSNAWTYFFVAVNIAFLLFFLFLLKDVICANLCRRCNREADAEDEEDLDIRGPKPVSEYLKGKIEHLLTRDVLALNAYRAQQQADLEQRKQLQELGFLNLDDTDEDAQREREEERKRAEKVKADVQRARLRRAGKAGADGVEMTEVRARAGKGGDDQAFNSPFSV
jgi:hypothetical protein